MQTMSKKENIRKEAEDAFRESMNAYLDPEFTGQSEFKAFREDLEAVEQLLRIENLVVNIIRSKEKLFSIETRKNKLEEFDKKSRPDIVKFHSTDLGKEFLRTINIIPTLSYYFPFHQLNPYVDLFIKHVMERQLDGYRPIFDIYIAKRVVDARLLANVDVLNDCIDGIKREARSPYFKKIMQNYQRRSSKNYKGLTKYINRLFERYHRLLVIRLDLSYKKQYCPNRNQEVPVTYSETNEHRNRFFNNMRSNTMFKNMLGYTCKLEYGPIKGFHYHLLLFFDGSQVQDDIHMARRIGEYWKETITKGKGLYYNCNAKKALYKHCGIGDIKYYDTGLRENLVKYTAAYLTKTDYYARIVNPDNVRTFFRGEMPQPRTSSVGRPRKYGEETATGQKFAEEFAI